MTRIICGIFFYGGEFSLRPFESLTHIKTKRSKVTFVTLLLFLKTDPNFDTNAPLFEVRGCNVILVGAILALRGAKNDS